MPSGPAHSGDMSQDSEREGAHRSRVSADASTPPSPLVRALTPSVPTRASRAIDPAARASKRMYEGLSASSVGLELGLAVLLALLAGRWLDNRFGTEPWLMLVFLGLGLFAGFRNVLRAVARAEKAAQEDAGESTREAANG